MKKFVALGLLAVSTASLLASCSPTTKDNLTSKVKIPRGCDPGEGYHVKTAVRMK